MKSLPNELLEQVFLTACEGKYHLDLKSSHETPPLQHILFRICRHWRTLAISSVALWSSIDVTNRGGDYQVASSVFHRNFLSMALRCSGTALISCKLALSVTPESQPHILALLRDLFQTSNRWRSLDISVTGLPWHELLPLQNNLAQLRTLSISFCHNTMGESPETKAGLSRLFSCAPRLSDVSFMQRDFVYDFPFSQIRNFSISTMTALNDVTALIIPYLTKISAASPDLDTLNVFGYFPSISSTQLPIYLPQVRKLLLRQADYSGRLLSILHLPALSSIYISSMSLITITQLLLELIPRCHCDIRSLDIEFHRDSGRKLGGDGPLFAKIVPHVLMLEELHVTMWDLHDSSKLETVLRLIEVPDSLPHLRGLNIVGWLPKHKPIPDSSTQNETLLACVSQLATIGELVTTRNKWCTRRLESISVSLRVHNWLLESDMQKTLFSITQLPAFRALLSMEVPRVTLNLSCTFISCVKSRHITNPNRSKNAGWYNPVP